MARSWRIQNLVSRCELRHNSILLHTKYEVRHYPTGTTKYIPIRVMIVGICATSRKRLGYATSWNNLMRSSNEFYNKPPIVDKWLSRESTILCTKLTCFIIVLVFVHFIAIENQNPDPAEVE